MKALARYALGKIGEIGYANLLQAKRVGVGEHLLRFDQPDPIVDIRIRLVRSQGLHGMDHDVRVISPPGNPVGESHGMLADNAGGEGQLEDHPLCLIQGIGEALQVPGPEAGLGLVDAFGEAEAEGVLQSAGNGNGELAVYQDVIFRCTSEQDGPGRRLARPGAELKTELVGGEISG